MKGPEDPRYESLMAIIGGFRRVAVALSGGNDSTLVALAAHDALGDDTAAFMVVTEALRDEDRAAARTAASSIGMDLVEIERSVLSSEEIARNSPDRCALCRGSMVEAVKERGEKMGFSVIADGAVLDDLDDYRPGFDRSTGMGVKHPLIEAGLRKSDVVDLLVRAGLGPVLRPPSPCLASRIPYGERLTLNKLRLVDHLEGRVRGLGFSQVRVRLFETSGGTYLGIVEVDDVGRAMEMWGEITPGDDGIRLVLDPRGYRMGSLNSLLGPP